MSTSNDSNATARRPRWGGLLAAGLVWALVGVTQAGVYETESKGDARDREASAAKSRPAAGSRGGYHLRCWQYGRLIFEEENLNPPAEGQGAYKLTLTDRGDRRQPIHLVETPNATCLLQPDREPATGNGRNPGQPGKTP